MFFSKNENYNFYFFKFLHVLKVILKNSFKEMKSSFYIPIQFPLFIYHIPQNILHRLQQGLFGFSP